VTLYGRFWVTPKGEVNSNLFKETNVEVTEQSQENTLLSRAK
jgi:hypothetical protein